MNTTQATRIILRPYITEKTFSLIEKDNRICFIVDKEASKTSIKEAIKTLYAEDAIDVRSEEHTSELQSH